MLRRVRSPRLAASPILAAGLLATLACTPADAPPPPGAIVISIDTLRADWLEPYGEEGPTSPELDAFADEAVVFEAAQSTSSWTLPSLASMLTSLEAVTHGANDFDKRIATDVGRLSEHLFGLGFHTGAIVSQALLARHYGLGRGFADYDDEMAYDINRARSTITSERISDKAVAWLEELAKLEDRPPWFLWLHYYDPHAEYLEHESFFELFDDPYRVACYRSEIAFTDHHLGRVFDALERLGLEDEVIVTITADHGEEFEDHGAWTHGKTLYREVVRIPLLVRAPGIEPRRVTAPVSLIDVGPTLLELMGQPPLPVRQGRSLVPYLRGEPIEPRPVVAFLDRNAAPKQDAIIEEDWKLIRDVESGDVRLYDLVADPLEMRDVAAEHADRVAELTRKLDQRMDESNLLRDVLGRARDLNVGSAERRALEDLGYIGE